MPTSYWWFPHERKVLEEFSDRLMSGEFTTAIAATRAMIERLRALRREQPDADWPAQERSLNACVLALTRRARSKGWVCPTQRWDGPAKQLLDKYVRAAARGQYRTMIDVARALLADIARRRERTPNVPWLMAPRNLTSVAAALRTRAHELGLPCPTTFWTPEERRLLDKYARRVIRQRGYSARTAARDLIKEAEAIRRRNPSASGWQIRRGFRAVWSKIVKRARELGRPWQRAAWSEAEGKILDRYILLMVKGKYRYAVAAARDALKEINALHRRHPGESWTRVDRTLVVATDRIRRRSRQARLRWPATRWSKEELAIVDRYARKVAQDPMHRLDPAAGLCWAELRDLQNRYCLKHLGIAQCAPPRSVSAVRQRLFARVSAIAAQK